MGAIAKDENRKARGRSRATLGTGRKLGNLLREISLPANSRAQGQHLAGLVGQDGDERRARERSRLSPRPRTLWHWGFPPKTVCAQRTSKPAWVSLFLRMSEVTGENNNKIIVGS